MSLPPLFPNAEDYFHESLAFLRDQQHLYKFPNIKLLSSNCLQRINIDGWEETDLLDEKLTLQDLAERNSQINDFLKKTDRFAVLYDVIEENSVDVESDAPLSAKKMHEIQYFAQELNATCQKADCYTVVDFGSGLGYLDQLIYRKHNYNVLGLESSNQIYTSAKSRQRKYHLESIDKVKYIRHKIDGGSHEAIGRYLGDKFGNHGWFCITGLHACADLSIDALDIFLEMAAAKSMVLMSCCYHKMALVNIQGRNFKNFPLSDCLKGVCLKNNGSDFLDVPFLRLATQPPNVKEHLKGLVFNLLARAVIQLYADKSDLKLTRRKRKAVKIKTVDNDFESYIQQANDGFQLTCNKVPCNTQNKDVSATNEDGNKCECELQFNFEELRQFWREHYQGAILKKAAIFVLLQRRLQPLFENLILYDRIMYLQEKGLKNCRIKKIFDDTISPRCFALVAIK